MVVVMKKISIKKNKKNVKKKRKEKQCYVCQSSSIYSWVFNYANSLRFLWSLDVSQ